VDVQSATLTTSGDVEIGGNLTVSGTQTILDVTTVSVEDPLIQLAKENTADSVDIGFYGKMVDGATTEYVGLYRDADDGKFKFFENATAAPTTTVSGGTTATVVANLEGAVTGNADTATTAAALTSARNIALAGDVSGSVSFDGSSNVSITTTIASGAVDNAMMANSDITFTDGSNSEAIALGATLEFGGTSGEVEVAYSTAANKFTVGLPDDVNIAGDLVVSGTISGTVAANSSTATKLATARTIALTGDVTGSASFDGSANASIAATIASASVENAMLANDGISLKLGGVTQEDINLGDDLNFAGTSNEVDVTYTALTNTLAFGLPSAITASLTGNASTATALETARTLSISGDGTGSASFDGTGNADIALTLASGAVDNAMLANNSVTVSDGSNTSSIALGGSLTIEGTTNEITVAHSSGVTTVSLPSTVSGLTSISSTGFTGALTGNASTATALETARTLSVSGDATGSGSFDGTGNTDIALTIAAGAVDNAMLANDGISLQLAGVAQEDINLGDDLNFAGTSNEVDITYTALSNTLTFGLPSAITASLTGNASTATALETARTISLSGDVTGSGSFDGTGNLAIASTLAGGTSLTFADGQGASEALDLGSTVTFAGTSNEVEVAYTTGTNTFTMGLPSAITAALTGNASTATALETARTIALTGAVTGSGSFDGTGNLSISSTLASGNLLTFSDGTNSETLAVGDTLKIEGTANEAEVAYSASTNKFTVGLPSTVSGLTSVSSTGFTGALTGNASTATALETSRTLSITGDATGSANFDGSANAAIALTIAAGAVDNAMLANDGIGLKLGGVAQEDINLGDDLNFAGTSNEVDVTYTAGTNTLAFGLPSAITASLTGNSSTATALETSRTLSISGDGTGSAAFDGTGNADIALTLASGAVDNAMLANDGISLKLGGVTQEDINLGDDLNFAGTSNEVEVAYTSGTNTLTFGLPSTITADLTGNADTATTWSGYRTITLAGDLTGSVTMNGGSSEELNATIATGVVDNAMLANDGISLQVDSVAQEDINLGDTLNFISGQDIDIAYNTTTNQLSVALEGTIDSDTTGNAATATAWAASRTITLGGDLGGSVAIDGSANATLTATIASTSVENSMLANSTVTLSADTGSNDPVSLGETITISGTANEIETATAGSNQLTIGLPNNVTVGNNLIATNDLTVTNGDLEITNGELSILGGGATISGAVGITGTTTINGNLIANSATMKFQDTVIEVGYNNTAVVDHGWHSKHSDGEYVGQAYDQSASEFIAFKTATKPTTTVDTSAVGYALADMRAKNIAANGSLLASGSVINNSAKAMFEKLSFASVSGTNTTISASSMVGGVVLRDASNDETDATATAAEIVAAMPSSARLADMTFVIRFIVSNSTSGYNFTAGSGVTIVGGSSSLTDKSHSYLVRVTNATGASEAVTMYKL
jgi:predicted phage tail protein